jgi:putative membrane protein
MGPNGWTITGPMGWGWGGTDLGLLWWLLALALVVTFVVGVTSLLFRVRDGDGGDEALDALRRRYARGEVDDEEFERRCARLDGGPTS